MQCNLMKYETQKELQYNSTIVYIGTQIKKYNYKYNKIQ